jgi:putative Holliday junction resolvase
VDPSVPGLAQSDVPEARLLAIDYGRRRIGLAISDAANWTATPLTTIERKGRLADIVRLRQIAREHGVRRVIVGHPLRMDGRPGEMADEAARFARRLAQALALPVELVDERLTSWAARQWQIERGKNGARPMDEIAAAILLEEYLGRSPENRG